MNEETNEDLEQLNIENAFSDLISEYFEEDNTIQNAENINDTIILDWDSVSNGQLLYTNIAEDITQTAQNNLKVGYSNLQEDIQLNVKSNETNVNGLLYNNLETFTENLQEVNQNGIYNELEKSNLEEVVTNDYGIVKTDVELLKKINNNTEINEENVNSANSQIADGTSFKLTQANLPAKIGFWTKVRNFFIVDSKIQYSVQTAQPNTGIWNKVQNFFSFGKDK